MIIDFQEIEEQQLKEFKGGKGTFFPRMFSDEKVKIMLGRLPQHAQIGYHRHEDNSEIIMPLSGKGIVNFEGEEKIILPGEVHYCPMGKSHALRNESSEDLLFYAIVPEHH